MADYLLAEKLKGVTGAKGNSVAFGAGIERVTVRSKSCELGFLLALGAGADVEQVHVVAAGKRGLIKKRGVDYLDLDLGKSEFFNEIREV